MSLDACFLTFLTSQLSAELEGSRVDKIYMPSRDEIVFALRGREKKKLLVSASTNSPRICITQGDYENPETPPTFCMVLRKHFTSARLKRVYMPQFERYAVLEFECKNDFFEPVDKNIIIELMGRSANLILTEGERIIDAVRRVDLSSSSGRCILPSAKYRPPTPQEGKIPFDALKGVETIFSNPELTLEKAIMDNVSGISPILARELAYLSSGRSEMRIKQLGVTDKQKLSELVQRLQSDMKEGRCKPCIVKRKDTGKMVDFCFFRPLQYGDFCEITEYETPSAAIEGFFSEGAKKARFEQKTKDLYQFINRTSARISRTMQVRKKELRDSEKAEQYRLYGELINANLYRIEKGQTRLECENYYDDCKIVTVPLKSELSPSQNAAAYFKKYTKAKNSRKVLEELIRKDTAELDYLDSVFLALCDCETSADAMQIRQELEKGGYLRRRSKVRGGDAPCKPRQFEKEGFLILVGRNNLQNDLVTVKLSRKNDIWLHTKNVHSSHVLISCGGQTPPDSVIEYAAGICAYYSNAKNDLKVEVDYCPVQHVRKPNGAKPGMVVYDGYETVVVNPIIP
ncbi:MAG: NFACT family protein [Clostridia bacterium]|nr:NFACT family protein [Clostridia bacterium]